MIARRSQNNKSIVIPMIVFFLPTCEITSKFLPIVVLVCLMVVRGSSSIIRLTVIHRVCTLQGVNHKTIVQ